MSEVGECRDCGRETKHTRVINGEEQPCCGACDDAHDLMQMTRMPAEAINGNQVHIAKLRRKARNLAQDQLSDTE